MHPYKVTHHTQHTHTLFAIAEMHVILDDVSGANGIVLWWPPLPRTAERRGSVSAAAGARSRNEATCDGHQIVCFGCSI